MKSLADKPEDASQSHEKRNGAGSSMRSISCSSRNRSVPFSGSAATPRRLKLLNIRFNALQTWLFRFHSVRFNAECQILCLDKSVVALGELVTEHLRVLGSDGIILVAAQRNGDLRAVGVLVRSHVEKR